MDIMIDCKDIDLIASKCNVEWSYKKERPPQVANSKSLNMPPVKNEK